MTSFVARRYNLDAEVTALPASAGGKPIPAEGIAIQRSAVHSPTAKDVDTAVLVTLDEFTVHERRPQGA